MLDFTYTVFLIVASMIGCLVTLFAVGIFAALLLEGPVSPEPAAMAELKRAA